MSHSNFWIKLLASFPLCASALFAQAAAALSPASLTFAGQALGTASPSQPTVLTNSGSIALSITGIALGGGNAGDFSETYTCGSSLAVAANCTIAVIFKPTAIGSRTASIAITDSAAGSPHSVALTGVGTTAPATAALSPAALTFSAQAVGSPSHPECHSH
jgi:hypothetical protein